MVRKLLRVVILIALVAMWVVLLVAYWKFYPTDSPIRVPFAVVGFVSSVIVIIAALPWFPGGPALPGARGTWVLRISAAVAAAMVGLILGGNQAGYVGPGTAAPPDSIRDPLNASAAVLAYAEGLTYASAHHTEDEQWLEVKDSAKAPVDSIIGPRARITPETNSFRNSRSDLGPGKGRIVARIWVDPGYRGGRGHPKLKLPPGISYLWIDNVAAKGDSVSLRAIIFSANRRPTLVRNAYYKWYPHMWASYPEGRWKFDQSDPCMCESCDSHGWCMVCGSFD